MGVQIPEQVGGRGASVSSARGTIQRKSRLGTEAAFAAGRNAVFNGMRSLCMTTVDGSVHRVYADQPAFFRALTALRTSSTSGISTVKRSLKSVKNRMLPRAPHMAMKPR